MVNKMPLWNISSSAAFLLRISEPGDPLLYYAVQEYGMIALAAMIWEDSLPKHYLPLSRRSYKEYQRDLETDMALLESTDYHILTADSPFWPHWLFHKFSVCHKYRIYSAKEMMAKPRTAPIALWIRAKQTSLPLLASPAISIVGTRSPSSYGRRVTEFFSSHISQSGITIISGGALGIDAIAHANALNNNGHTIAVLAGGVDDPSPKSNADIFAHILHQGLMISEYPPGTKPLKHRFLIRNRLIAALGEVVLIVEAPYRSGALNTTWWAEELHTPVASIPGPIGQANNWGNLTLLRENRAILCVEPEHCIELMSHASNYGRKKIENNSQKTAKYIQQEIEFQI